MDYLSFSFHTEIRKGSYANSVFFMAEVQISYSQKPLVSQKCDIMKRKFKMMVNNSTNINKTVNNSTNINKTTNNPLHQKTACKKKPLKNMTWQYRSWIGTGTKQYLFEMVMSTITHLLFLIHLIEPKLHD